MFVSYICDCQVLTVRDTPSCYVMNYFDNVITVPGRHFAPLSCLSNLLTPLSVPSLDHVAGLAYDLRLKTDQLLLVTRVSSGHLGKLQRESLS